MATELIKGTASAVRHTIHVSGDRDGVSTKHHTIFKIGDTTVMFTSGSPPIIGDGDRLVVAGRLRGRVLICDAYLNRTALIRGDSGLWHNFAAAAFCIAVGAVVVGESWFGWFFPPLRPGDLPNLVFLGVGLCFFVIGLFLLYRWARIRRAVKLVKGG